jgi:hypothetical protein
MTPDKHGPVRGGRCAIHDGRVTTVQGGCTLQAAHRYLRMALSLFVYERLTPEEFAFRGAEHVLAIPSNSRQNNPRKLKVHPGTTRALPENGTIGDRQPAWTNDKAYRQAVIPR